ncbi:MAG: glycoside hydrolase [Balneolaceae bacterium]|nr:glycoside hydrolase [Balneolaceae bacterium]
MNIKLLGSVVVIFFMTTCNGDNISTEKQDQKGDLLEVTVNLEESYQVIRGFGASDAWSIQFVGKNWSLEKRERIADLLFSTDVDDVGNPVGIGLSIWRFNIGAGSARQGEESGINDPWRRAESFLTADSTYDWNRQQGQQWFVRAAAERGVDTFIGFVNSPPVLLTKTGKAYGDGGERANIAPHHYDDFADYLARIGTYFESQGTPFSYLSPVNEPQWDWSQDNGQEGSPYQNVEIDGVVQALNQKLQEYNLDTKIEIPETAQIDFLYAGNLPGRSRQIEHFFGPESDVRELPAVAQKMAGHSYFTTWPISDMIEKRRRVRQHIEQAAAPIEYWMSEYCILANNEEIRGGSRDFGINPALYVARVLHYDMTVAHASSWQWWLAVSPYDFKDGLVYIDQDIQNGRVYESKLLWGLGNYSRFIRPGSVRVGISRSDRATPEEASRGIMASAYKHSESGNITVVLINYSREQHSLSLTFQGGESAEIGDVTPFVTSASQNLEQQPVISVDEPLFLPARSVTTLQAVTPN